MDPNQNGAIATTTEQLKAALPGVVEHVPGAQLAVFAYKDGGLGYATHDMDRSTLIIALTAWLAGQAKVGHGQTVFRCLRDQFPAGVWG